MSEYILTVEDLDELIRENRAVQVISSRPSVNVGDVFYTHHCSLVFPSDNEVENDFVVAISIYYHTLNGLKNIGILHSVYENNDFVKLGGQVRTNRKPKTLLELFKILYSRSIEERINCLNYSRELVERI